ncbi:MltA-interacting MipA family protein [Allostella vacuolata]|nr:MltA-interacting MipA family protein [Stella vacuolata]
MTIAIHLFQRAALAATSLAALGIATAAAQGPDPSRRWSATLGVGALVAPEYEGSDKMEVLPLPLIDARWTVGYPGLQQVFLTTEQGLGVQFFDIGGFSLAASVNYDPGRDQDDGDRLRGLGDVEAGANLRLTAAYRYQGFRLGLAAGRTFGGADGVQVDGSASYTHQFGSRFSLTASAGVVWADSNYMEGYFGVSRQQSIRSGLAPYEAEAGFKSARIALTGRYALGDHWGLRATVGVSQLLGDAADSPVVEEELQPFALVGITYSF